MLGFTDFWLLTFLALTSFLALAARTTLLTFLTFRAWCCRFLTRCFFNIPLVTIDALWTLSTIFFVALVVATTATTIIAVTATIATTITRLLGRFWGYWSNNRSR